MDKSYFFITLLFITSSIMTVTMHNVEAVIFLAGKSKRFDGDLSKLLTPIHGKPVLYYPLKAVYDLHVPMTLVLGHQKEEVKKNVEDYFKDGSIQFAIQEHQLGTGHALKCTKNYWHTDNIMVLNGDHPLTSAPILHTLIRSHEETNADITILVTKPTYDCKWGRIVTQDGKISIVEAADFDKDLQEHPFVNAGYYIFKRTFLEEHINELWLHHNKGEYYVTDLIEIANRSNLHISCVEVPFNSVFGINTKEEFSYAEKLLEQRDLE